MNALPDAVLSADARMLETFLHAHCLGRDRAEPEWKIIADLAAQGVRIKKRDFELAAEELALATGDVGSCTAGFFWADSPEDYDVAYAWLVGRFDAQRARAERIKARKTERFTQGLFDAWGLT